MLNQVDLSAEAMRDGRWFQLGKTSLKICHASNKVFKTAVAGYTKNERITVTDACKAMAEGLLVDWKDVKDLNGADVQYSLDMAYRALITNKPLREFVESTSSDLGMYEGN